MRVCKNGDGDIWGKGDLELLALTGTKLKGNGKILWCWVNHVIVGVHEIERAREGVTVLLKFKFSKV